MATEQQKLLNKWIERNYETLQRTMPQKDMLHSAYITVYHFRRPYIPTAERFRSLMEEAYHRHILSEFNHSMHFVLPDPLYWLYLDEDENANGLLDDTAISSPSHSLSDLSSYSLTQLFAFVKRNFPQEVFNIFKMAVVEQRTIADISLITGMKKNIIRRHLDDIECAIRRCRVPGKKRKANK